MLNVVPATLKIPLIELSTYPFEITLRNNMYLFTVSTAFWRMADMVLNFGFGCFFGQTLCSFQGCPNFERFIFVNAGLQVQESVCHGLPCTVSFSEHAGPGFWTQALIVTAASKVRNNRKHIIFIPSKTKWPNFSPSKHKHNAGKMRLLELVSYWSAQHWSRPIGRQGQKHLQKTVSQALAT